ncbi:MAG TPA: 4Fe-4S dicluster domain-containing protein [Methanosarcinales archaeon]|nr:4Fe-4S dicluster domain-containing protein [Methanosarcinales archaeon]
MFESQVDRGLAVIDRKKCTLCGTCVEVCPRSAIVRL